MAFFLSNSLGLTITNRSKIIFLSDFSETTCLWKVQSETDSDYTTYDKVLCPS